MELKLQVLCICCDPLVMHKTISTWSDCSERIVIFANGPRAQEIKSVLSQIQKCKVIIGNFIGFSETRNLLIELSQPDKYDYNIMIDDSYELRGDLINCLFKQIQIGGSRGLIKIRSGNNWQQRKLIFGGKGRKAKYIGKIHETIECSQEDKIFSIPETECFIEDIVYLHHLQRTIDRMDYDLSQIGDGEKLTRRDNYYKACIYWKKGGKGNLGTATEIFKNLISQEPNSTDAYSSLAKKYLLTINERNERN